MLREMGATIELEPDGGVAGPEPTGTIRVRSGRRLQGITVSGARVAGLIDELPVLAVAMAAASGRSEVRDAGELRLKESDRISLMVRNLARDRCPGGRNKATAGDRLARHPAGRADRDTRRPSHRDGLRDRGPDRGRGRRGDRRPGLRGGLVRALLGAPRAGLRGRGRAGQPRRCARAGMRRLRLLTAGESHGPAITGILEGLPAGMRVSTPGVDRDLARRQHGYGSGRRMQIERDRVRWTAGIRFGQTLGSPVGFEVANLDWENWTQKMAQEDVRGARRPKRITLARPGHADLAGAIKYDTDDIRNVLERASARSTTTRVLAGALARQLLATAGVRIWSFVDQLGPIRAFGGTDDPVTAVPDGWLERDLAEPSPLRCPDPEAERAMTALVDECIAAGDSDRRGVRGRRRGPAGRARFHGGVGYATRRGPGCCGDGHPRGQGRGHRRWVRGRRDARTRPSRRGRPRRGRLVAPHQPCRRHRRRHVQRRAGGRPGRREAGRDAAQSAPGDRPRHRPARASAHRAERHRDPAARRGRRRGDGGAGARRRAADQLRRRHDRRSRPPRSGGGGHGRASVAAGPREWTGRGARSRSAIPRAKRGEHVRGNGRDRAGRRSVSVPDRAPARPGHRLLGLARDAERRVRGPWPAADLRAGRRRAVCRPRGAGAPPSR